MSRIVVRAVAESRRASAALLQIRCPNGGRGFFYASRRRRVAASVRPLAVVPHAPQRAGARSSCSSFGRWAFRIRGLLPAVFPRRAGVRSACSAWGRRAVPHPRPPAGGFSAPCRGPFRLLRMGPEGRSASQASCRRSFRIGPEDRSASRRPFPATVPRTACAPQRIADDLFRAAADPR